MSEPSAGPAGRRLIGILGPIPLSEVGITDAHNHVWIDRVLGADPDAPVLDDLRLIQDGLVAYRQAGGSAILDCQPGGSGRNGTKMAELSARTGVYILAATGFHLRKYYPPDYWLFDASTEEAAQHFIGELTVGLQETRTIQPAVRAGFIKAACQETLEQTPGHLLEAVAQASLVTGSALAVHTERGAAAHSIARALTRQGVPPDRLILCHMDKRPDLGLHLELAKEGILLEYDTFFRPKYEPEILVWPLLERMAGEGYAHSIALATDMAERDMWSNGQAGGRLVDLLTIVAPRLRSLGFDDQQVAALLGRNVTTRLATDFPAETKNLKENR